MAQYLTFSMPKAIAYITTVALGWTEYWINVGTETFGDVDFSSWIQRRVPTRDCVA